MKMFLFSKFSYILESFWEKEAISQLFTTIKDVYLQSL